MRSLPGYAIHGSVVSSTGEPIRGAAVSAGKELVYTVSDGSFTAQFVRPIPVKVALVPTQFLAPVAYRAITDEVMVTPTAIGSGQPLLLQAQLCSQCELLQDDPVQTMEPEPARVNTFRGGVAAVRTTLVQLGRRMLHMLPRRRQV